jgi:BMFP domain-containing protein YqiC
MTPREIVHILMFVVTLRAKLAAAEMRIAQLEDELAALKAEQKPDEPTP